MSFYTESREMLRRLDQPDDLPTRFWNWLVYRSDDEHLLRDVSRGDVAALERVLLNLGRSQPLRRQDLPYHPREVSMHLSIWPTMSPLTQAFLKWSYRFTGTRELFIHFSNAQGAIEALQSFPQLERLHVVGHFVTPEHNRVPRIIQAALPNCEVRT